MQEARIIKNKAFQDFIFIENHNKEEEIGSFQIKKDKLQVFCHKEKV